MIRVTRKVMNGFKKLNLLWMITNGIFPLSIGFNSTLIIDKHTHTGERTTSFNCIGNMHSTECSCFLLSIVPSQLPYDACKTFYVNYMDGFASWHEQRSCKCRWCVKQTVYHLHHHVWFCLSNDCGEKQILIGYVMCVIFQTFYHIDIAHLTNMK